MIVNFYGYFFLFYRIFVKDCASEIRAALEKGFIPFPYKVAKALDAEIYRNVEFDVWNEAKKGIYVNLCVAFPNQTFFFFV